jgi:5-formyltetrahydrofolate cyclo-ligase
VEITTKAQLRTQFIAARRALDPDVRAAEAATLALQVGMLVATGDTACAYVPVGTEPGSIAMLDALSASGTTVLLPVAVTEDGIPQALRWSAYRAGGLVTAAYGLLEPDGPRLPPTAIAEASVIVIPALAVDKRGVRLGRGAGFYDRSLPLRDPRARMVAVVRDDEVVDELPADTHDVRMTHALTPGGGLVSFQHDMA